MTSRCIDSADQLFFVFPVESRKVSPKMHEFADLAELPESWKVKTRCIVHSRRTALGRAMHVERCIRNHGVPFLFRLFTKCWCYTNCWCFSKAYRFFAPYQPIRHILYLYLPCRCSSCNIIFNPSRWRICYWTWTLVDHDLHVCTCHDLHITNWCVASSLLHM